MKIIVASDIHGSAYYCKQLMEVFEASGAERMLLLGDLLYHGPRNDLPRDYAPKEVIAMLNHYQDRLYAIQGNCDTQVDQMVLDFPVLAEYCLLEAAGRLIFAAHGHHHNLQSPPPLKPGDVLLHGHTHIPAKDNSAGFWYLNPGSVSLPKENTPKSYMTLENGVFLWKTLDGTEYDSLKL